MIFVSRSTSIKAMKASIEWNLEFDLSQLSGQVAHNGANGAIHRESEM